MAFNFLSTAMALYIDTNVNVEDTQYFNDTTDNASKETKSQESKASAKKKVKLSNKTLPEGNDLKHNSQELILKDIFLGLIISSADQDLRDEAIPLLKGFTRHLILVEANNYCSNSNQDDATKYAETSIMCNALLEAWCLSLIHI